jgi:transcriptional regulator with XRE-family HTH domain
VDAGAVDFGALLRQARRREGLSQVELGGSKYSGSYISHLESGRRQATPEIMEFLARRLGVSPLEWGISARAEEPRFGITDPIEDLLVAEHAWSDHDWDAALLHATAAADAAVRSGDTGREWEARYVMAQAKFASGDFPGAAAIAEEISESPLAHRFAVARAQALSLASVSHRASDRLGWAVAFGARAVEAAAATPPIILAEALMSLVSAMSEAGHPAVESKLYLDRLEQLAPRLSSEHSRGMIAWTIGAAAFAAGDIDEGLRQQHRAAELLDPRRDLRLWLRFHSTSAWWRLRAGITDGVSELLRTAAVGLEIMGNAYDVVELRQCQAQLALLTGDAQGGAKIIAAVLDDPELGGERLSRGNSELLLADCLHELDDPSARRWYASAARQLEQEGRLKAALEAMRSATADDVDEKLTIT